MGLFEWLFKKPNVDVANHYDGYFKTLTAYEPHFTTWNGQISNRRESAAHFQAEG